MSALVQVLPSLGSWLATVCREVWVVHEIIGKCNDQSNHKEDFGANYLFQLLPASNCGRSVFQKEKEIAHCASIENNLSGELTCKETASLRCCWQSALLLPGRKWLWYPPWPRGWLTSWWALASSQTWQQYLYRSWLCHRLLPRLQGMTEKITS